jgi:N-methylhydantoinase B
MTYCGLGAAGGVVGGISMHFLSAAELGGAGAAPIALLCNFERVRYPARGRNGGQAGAAGNVTLRSGRPIRPKGRQTVPPRDAIRLELPGGGGFGDPRERDPERVLDDLLDGMITANDARRDYGVVVDKHGRIDLTETNRLRALRQP